MRLQKLFITTLLSVSVIGTAMVDNVQEELFKAGYEMKQMEGYREGNWILLDFGDIIIHIFDKENRLFYDLERIWKDGKEVSIEELN